MTEIQEALELAFQQHEEKEEPENDGSQEEVQESETTETAETESEPEQPSGESGEQEPEGRSDTDEPSDTPEQVQAVEQTEEIKAPQSWSPVAREKWKDLPPEVQQEALKRDSEVNKALQESAQARRMVDTVNNMFGQYQSLFTAQGTDPITGTSDILKTAAVLQGGSPQQKAQAVAGIIQNFGVDIATLDGVLSGKVQNQQNPELQHLQSQIQEQNRIMQELMSHQQQSYQAQQATIDKEVSAFVQSHEFANDLRMVMADFMDIAERQGQPIDMETAYNRALATRPDLQQILNARRPVQTSQDNIQKARNANVSLPQNAAPEPPKKAPETMREAILQAMENS